MNGILDVLLRGMDIVERLRNVSAVSGMQMILFGVLLVFGIINCVLGYRLLRFWMMLFGFILGCGLGFGASFFMGTTDNTVRIAVTVGVGIALAVLVFISYKAGIFVMGAGLGIGIAVYVLHPTSSLVFFICLLAGAGLGSLAMKWAREVIIVGTSLLGGAMAGMSLAKLGGLADFPYGIGLSAAFAALGMLIQFATNRVKYEEPEEYEEPVVRKKKRQKEAYKEKMPEYDEAPVRRKKRTVSPENRGYSERERQPAEQFYRNRVPLDIQVGDEDTYTDYPIESEKTIIYRPRRKTAPDFDLPLDSYAYDDSYGRRPYPKNSPKKQTYTVKVNPESSSGRQADRERREFYADLDRGASRVRKDIRDSRYAKNTYAEQWEDDDLYDDEFYEDELYDSDFYDEPIDEDELEDEIIREMMEDDDKESILPWKNRRDKKSRKEGHSGKRG